MNILIPCAGIGKRFKDEGYDLPKPLIMVNGKPMICHLINNLVTNDSDKIYIGYLIQFDFYNFKDVVKKHSNKQIEFIQISYNTNGAVETLNIMLKDISNNDNVLVIDCDTFYLEDIIKNYRYSLQKNVVFYFNDETNNEAYSFIKLDNENVVDIVEKKKISNNANIGAYGFESVNLLKKYCDYLLGNNIRQKNEFYVSGLYKQMISDNINVIGKEIKEFYNVGVPEKLKDYCIKIKDSKKLRICFDLDNTLVTYPTIKDDYTTVNPINKNINYLKFLKSIGCTIIIYTARRMKTHKGNVGSILKDVGKITFDTLDKFDIPYDEIYFGKPYADFYIDDLAVNPYIKMEESIGIYTDKLECRNFNKIEFIENKVIKHTVNKGESYFYNNIPLPVISLFPKVISIDCQKDYDVLTLENIKGFSISKKFIDNNLSLNILEEILNSLDDIHNSSIPLKNINIYENYSKKTKDRVNSFDYSKLDKDWEYLYNIMIHGLDQYEHDGSGTIKVIHGDPVFSNIISYNGIKFIDMRGKIGETLTIFGDVFYDYAKIYQSLCGYDFILNNKIDIYECDELKQYLKSYIKNEYKNFDITNLSLLTANMFFTLIPLHEELNKQRMYYEKYKGLMYECIN